MSDDLAEFLLARIAEDEKMAHALKGARFSAYHERGDEGWSRIEAENGDSVALVADESFARHCARWDPARVLVECEAKRQVVKQYQRFVASDVGMLVKVAICDQLEEVLCLLAHPYADHPGFRPEWRLEPQERR